MLALTFFALTAVVASSLGFVLGRVAGIREGLRRPVVVSYAELQQHLRKASNEYKAMATKC